MAKELGLFKRGNVFCYRRRVPQDLVATFGRSEIKESLGTSDKAVAKIRLYEVALKWERTFESARLRISRLTKDAIFSEVVRFVSDRSKKDAEALHQFDANPPSSVDIDEATKAALLEARSNINIYKNRNHELTRLAISALIKDTFGQDTPPFAKRISNVEKIELNSRTLNARHISAPRGGSWSASQVRRVIQRLASNA